MTPSAYVADVKDTAEPENALLSGVASAPRELRHGALPLRTHARMSRDVALSENTGMQRRAEQSALRFSARGYMYG